MGFSHHHFLLYKVRLGSWIKKREVVDGATSISTEKEKKSTKRDMLGLLSKRVE